MLLGSPRLKEVPTRSHINVRKYIVFFEQNEIPVSSHGRFELARQLTILADLHPDKKLLIVARNSSGETSNHQALDNMRLAHILQEREGRTVEVYNGNWMTIADDIEFAVSVSSTALLEASILQIPSFSIPIGEESKSPFNASRFFQRVGFERQLGDLVGPLPLKPVARAADFLAPLRHECATAGHFPQAQAPSHNEAVRACSETLVCRISEGSRSSFPFHRPLTTGLE
ncbi:hypothetical protein Q1M63_10350 (plasmid) [Sinorhizobium meliloti]|nr:hypothetical protein Q1M63_10350 [Sinorhizobium meliloti]